MSDVDALTLVREEALKIWGECGNDEALYRREIVRRAQDDARLKALFTRAGYLLLECEQATKN